MSSSHEPQVKHVDAALVKTVEVQVVWLHAPQGLDAAMHEVARLNIRVLLEAQVARITYDLMARLIVGLQELSLPPQPAGKCDRATSCPRPRDAFGACAPAGWLTGWLAGSRRP